MEKRLLRSRQDRMVAGICGGLAAYFDIDPTLVRLLFALLTLASSGVLIVAYIVLWLIMPEEGPQPTEAPPPTEHTEVDSTQLDSPESDTTEAESDTTEAESDATEVAETSPQPALAKPAQPDPRLLGWIILAVGVYFLLDRIGLGVLTRSLWPALLIILGLVLLLPFLRNRR